MNVNIWGPSLWILLQNTAFILDETGKENVAIYENLKVLLPCSFCRNSFIQFIYPDNKSSTWLPQKDFYAKWVYELHSKVNRKLNQQHVDETVTLAPLGLSILLKRFLNIIVDTNMKVLFKEPSFEVVQKRYLVSKEEPYRKLDVEIVLLAMAMYGETIYDADTLKTWRSAFVSWIFEMHSVSKHPSFEAVYLAFTGKKTLNGFVIKEPMSVPDIVELIKTLKYRTFPEKDVCASLLKAGACVKNTCQ